MKNRFSFKEARLGDQYYVYHENELSHIEIVSLGYVDGTRLDERVVGVEVQLLNGEFFNDCIDDSEIHTGEISVFKTMEEFKEFEKELVDIRIKDLEKELKELKSQKEK